MVAPLSTSVPSQSKIASRFICLRAFAACRLAPRERRSPRRFAPRGLGRGRDLPLLDFGRLRRLGRVERHVVAGHRLEAQVARLSAKCGGSSAVTSIAAVRRIDPDAAARAGAACG